MSYTNRELLYAAVSQDELDRVYPIPEGESENAELMQAIKEADQKIASIARVSVPEDPSEAHGMLQSIAATIIVWKMTGRQTRLSSEEIERRRADYFKALDLLYDIGSGEIVLEEVDDPFEPKFEAQRRRVENW